MMKYLTKNLFNNIFSSYSIVLLFMIAILMTGCKAGLTLAGAAGEAEASPTIQAESNNSPYCQPTIVHLSGYLV